MYKTEAYAHYSYNDCHIIYNNMYMCVYFDASDSILSEQHVNVCVF